MWVEAAVQFAAYPNEHPATKTLAIIVGVVSSVLCAFYLLLDKISLHQSGFATILAVWWLPAIALSFVPSSFIRTCNGFASTWISVFLALYHLRLARGPHDLEAVPSAEPEDEVLGAGFCGPTTSYSCSSGDVGEHGTPGSVP